jgi:hypothetical protein
MSFSSQHGATDGRAQGRSVAIHPARGRHGISKDDLIALNLGQSAAEGERVQPIQQTADAKE